MVLIVGKRLEEYFYSEKNQKLLNVQKKVMIETFKNYNRSKTR